MALTRLKGYVTQYLNSIFERIMIMAYHIYELSRFF